MSDATINAGFIRQYRSNIELLLQQMGSRLRKAVTEDAYKGEQARAVQQLQKTAAVKRTTRHADTPLIPTVHDARWVFPVDYEWADLIADIDVLRMLDDPQSSYAMNAAMALGRSIDEEIIEAFFGDSKTGANGSTTTSFPAGQIVGVQVGGGGSDTGLNVEKLRNAKKILMANDVDIDNEEFFLAITAEQHDDLFAETQAISLDFNTRPVLVDGKISSFFGFNFIHTELLQNTADPYRRVPAWVKSGMHLGVWNDMKTRIDERADKSFETQVFASETIGATRLEEGKVVEILCDEA